MSADDPNLPALTTGDLPLPDSMTRDQWLDIGHDIAQAVKRSMWWLGQWWNHGDRQWGAGPADAEAIGMAYQTCRNAGSVAARFDLSRRRDNLSFSHHAAVAALPKAEQDQLLDRAESEGWTRERTRAEAQQHRRALAGQETHRPDYGPYAVHPVAAVFPLIEGDEFEAFVLSVKEIGLVMPITLTADGSTIVDGKIRYLACKAAGVEPVFRRLGSHYDEQKTFDYIISANLIRKSVSPDQRAVAGAKLATAPGWTQERAARAVAVPLKLVRTAETVTRDAPDLVEQVKDGTLDLGAADRERRKRVARYPRP